MKAKTSNKLNIVLIAITLLLLFVAGVNAIGSTGSWLNDKDEIGFELNVQAINIEVKQDDRVVDNTGYIYLGTDTIVADTEYSLNVTITNKEEGVGYYIRYQALAVVNGVTYNINSCITGDFEALATDDGWLYSVDSEGEKTAMAPYGEDGSTLTLIDKVEFPASFIDSVQGQYIKLHLFIEGSATGVFGDTTTQD